MAYTNYVLKGVVNINGYDAKTKTIKYSLAVVNNKSGSLLWRAPDLEYRTVSGGRRALINLNQAVRVVIWKELNLPRSTVIRVEVANTKDALLMLPEHSAFKPRVVIKGSPAKVEKANEPETKYAVVQVNGVWTIKAFQVPKLMTKEEATEELLNKICQ